MGRIYRREDDSGYYGSGSTDSGGMWTGVPTSPAAGGQNTGGNPGGYIPLPSAPIIPTTVPTAPTTPTSSPQDFWTLFQEYMSKMPGLNMPDPNKYFDASGINRTYDTSRGNILSNMYSAQSRAANQAGALAGANGMLNRGGFTMRATTDAALPYTQALGQNETARAGSLQGNQQNLYNALMGQTTAQAGYQQQGIGNVFQMMNQGYNQQNLDLERQRLAQQNEQFGKTYDLQRFTSTIMPMFQKQWQDFITNMQQQPGSDKLDWGTVYQNFMKQMGLNMFGGGFGSSNSGGGS